MWLPCSAVEAMRLYSRASWVGAMMWDSSTAASRVLHDLQGGYQIMSVPTRSFPNQTFPLSCMAVPHSSRRAPSVTFLPLRFDYHYSNGHRRWFRSYIGCHTVPHHAPLPHCTNLHVAMRTTHGQSCGYALSWHASCSVHHIPTDLHDSNAGTMGGGAQRQLLLAGRGSTRGQASRHGLVVLHCTTIGRRRGCWWSWWSWWS